MSVTVSAADLLKRRLERFSRALPGVDEGDERSVHRARVATRRLRELVPVLQLDAAVSKKLGRRLRKVTHQLGVVRERQVLALLIDELHSARPGAAVQRDTLKRVGTAVKRVAKKGERARKPPTRDLWRLARKLERVVDDLRDAEHAATTSSRQRRAASWAIDARIAHRAARVSKAVQDAGAVYLPGRLHDVRVALKKLRYALELSSEMAGGKANAALTALRRTQGVLGRMHDVQVLIDHVRDMQAALTPPNVTLWRELDALVIALEDKCRRLHARYVRERDAIQGIAARLAVPASRAAASTSARSRERRAG